MSPTDGAMPQPSTAASTLALNTVDRFLSEIESGDLTSAERVAAQISELSVLATADLPAPAREHWSRAARLLRTPADKPVPDRAASAIKSWPQARVTELLTHIRDLQGVLEKIENDRLEDEIRDRIRRHYL